MVELLPAQAQSPVQEIEHVVVEHGLAAKAVEYRIGQAVDGVDDDEHDLGPAVVDLRRLLEDGHEADDGDGDDAGQRAQHQRCAALQRAELVLLELLVARVREEPPAVQVRGDGDFRIQHHDDDAHDDVQ